MTMTFWGLFNKNFKQLIRQRKRTVIMFTLPLCMFALIFLFFTLSKIDNTSIKPINIGVIDNDKSIYSSALVNAYMDNESFTDFVNINIGKDDIKQSFEDGKLDAIIEIPENYSNYLMYFEHIPVNVKVAYNNPLKAVLFKNVMESYEKYITSVQVGVEVLYDKMTELSMSKEEISLYNNEISYELIMTSVGRNKFFKYNELVNVPSTTSINYFFIAIIMMFLMYISVFTSIDLIREKENMCFRRLRIGRVSIFEYLISKLLSSTIYIFLIVVSWFLIISIFTNLTLNNNLILIIMYIFSCITLSVSFAMIISSVFERDESIILVSNIFIFVNAIVGGSIIPIHYMPSILRKIAIITPNYWMIKGLLHISSGFNATYGLVIMGVFFIMAIIFTYISYIRYNTIE
ncbi:MAG: ABC transporter permease [Vallitalea sp.]|jgi:ABC-2 type transport system permease protein|nr:ABC transporter permease [Vallitalea sp.]